MKYEERLEKLNGLSEFINGENQDDILLVLDKKYPDDKWNIICSAVHWFRTVESYLNSEKLLKENKEDYNWGEVYLFLSSVDIVIEGINDINKIAKDNEKARLFYKSSEIFKDKEKDDWEYFKNIRAIFGAHPTKLKDNNEFIVSTYPTPYNSLPDKLYGKAKNWDYYTLLWKKDKRKSWEQLEFGFSFKEIEKYLDKCIDYLDNIYNDFLVMINAYKKELSKIKIQKIDKPIKQLNILIKEDEKRLNGRYNVAIKDVKMLLTTEITDKQNKRLYEKFKNVLINQVQHLYNALQYPEKIENINGVENIIDSKVEYFTKNSSYYYTKLYEYWNNEDMEMILINHFSDRIKPFNANISNIRELYCLVKAYNYFKSLEK
ncbi:MAG: hypothetical protein IJH39_09090 [Clostridia bacterium]|nr:hypothetical protein [Clostridia bacterium]